MLVLGQILRPQFQNDSFLTKNFLVQTKVADRWTKFHQLIMRNMRKLSTPHPTRIWAPPPSPHSSDTPPPPTPQKKTSLLLLCVNLMQQLQHDVCVCLCVCVHACEHVYVCVMYVVNVTLII